MPDHASRDASHDVRLDAQGLRVLAHPLRARLLTRLRTTGPSTATALAAVLGTNSGATSYHLRRLAEVGLVVDTEEGRGRERIWRASSHTHSWTPSEFAGDPDAEAALDWLDGFYLAAFAERYERWLVVKSEWSAAWQDGFGLGDTALRLTADELVHLREEIEVLVQRYRTATSEAASDSAIDDGRREVALYTVAVPSEPTP